jgi:hypothetical protein
VSDTASHGDETAMWLRYGVPAEPLGEPDRTFGILDDGEELTFGTFPSGFTRRADMDVHEEDAGRILLSAADDQLYERFGNGFDRLDVDTLVADVETTTLFSEAEARMLVLCGWFGMDRESVAAGLELTEPEVSDLIRSARIRRNRAEATAEMMFPLLVEESDVAGEE